MNLVIDELRRTQKYHLKQLEENLQSIRNKEESIEMLKAANEKHRETLEQIGEAVKKLEKDIAATMPIEKDCTNSITEVG